MAMTFSNKNGGSAEFVERMICGKDMETTRESYASRCLGYGELSDGDFALITSVPEWIESVKQTACNLPTTIDILSQWKASSSKSKHFAIWLKNR